MLAEVAQASRPPSPPALPGGWSFRQHPFATSALGAGYPVRVEERGGPLRLAGMADGGIALVVLAYHHPFGQGQGQTQIDFAVVENVGFELDAGGGLVQVFLSLPRCSHSLSYIRASAIFSFEME